MFSSNKVKKVLNYNHLESADNLDNHRDKENIIPSLSNLRYTYAHNSNTNLTSENENFNNYSNSNNNTFFTCKPSNN